MLQNGIVVFAALIGLSPVLSAQEPGNKDRDALQGTWNVSKFVVAGKDGAEDLNKKVTFVIAGDSLTVKLDKDTLSEGKFVLDQAPSPKHITVTSTTAADKGETKLGIYEIDGDMLKLCFSLEDAGAMRRPADFTSNNDRMTLVAVLQRAKK
jgi:uncharacterized protein (TIGR03067 family)